MKSPRFGLTLCLTAAIALTSLTACRSSGDRSSGRVLDDRMVNRHVKGALSSSTMYKFPDVRAQTYAGVVQLSGFVESQEQRTQAAALAANVPGVHEVVNSLVLKPQETTVVTTPGTVPMSGTPTTAGSTTTTTTTGSTTTPTGSTTGRRYYDSDVSPPGNANPGTNPNQNPNTPKNPQNPNSNQPQ